MRAFLRAQCSASLRRARVEAAASLKRDLIGIPNSGESSSACDDALDDRAISFSSRSRETHLLGPLLTVWVRNPADTATPTIAATTR